MAIYHLSAKAISRSTGRSATAAAAYRSGTEIADQRTGEMHDYSRKSGVLHTEIIAPANAPEWATDRGRLWNTAEQAERRKDAKVAREIVVALPTELNRDAHVALARELARTLTDRYGVAVDVAIHAPSRGGDDRNHHAHLLMTTRRMGPDGLTDKTRVLDVSTTAAPEMTAIRAAWAGLCNQALERAGQDV